MANAKQVILDVARDFEAMTGRHYDLFERYRLDDAEYVVVCMNSTAGTAKNVVDRLRDEGVRAGLLKVRVFRPFPGEEMAKALENCKAVAVMDRCESYSTQGGPLGAELMSAMYRNKNKAEAINIVYGLSGRDVTVSDMEGVFERLADIAKNGVKDKQYTYLGLRG
jgi:pyruvate ferredoxin oxidoreductase alpha subunit